MAERVADTAPGVVPRAPAARARPPTMADVASHVGVSRQLVSLVLRDQPGASAETRAKVLAAAKELGYRPDGAARVLRRNRSGLLGVLFVAGHPFDMALVENMYPAAEQAGYSIALGAIAQTHDEARAVDDMLGYRSEALILIGPELPPDELSRLAERLPIVEVGRHRSTPGVDAVFCDGEHGIRLAMDHLISLGHRHIVHVDGGNMPGADDRRRGYVGAMTEAGLRNEIDVIPGDYSELAGHRAALEIMARSKRPTAVVAANDQTAFGLLGTVTRAGIAVPEDISISGFDDERTARLPFIDLTTVAQNAAEMARLTLQAVAERLDGHRSEMRQLLVEPELIVRSSTGPAR